MPRILLVDDHPVVREGLGRVLSSALTGTIVGHAERAVDARLLLSRGPWDLVILDLTLGSDDGFAVLKWLRQTYPATPVLVVSMHAPEQFARRALQTGAYGYVSKNSAPHELIRAVESALAGHVYMPPRLEEMLADRSRESPHDALSDREYQVLRLIGQGHTVSRIAADLSLSVKTVSTYRARILDKMHMRNTAELMRYVIAHDLVPAQPSPRD